MPRASSVLVLKPPLDQIARFGVHTRNLLIAGMEITFNLNHVEQLLILCDL
jgi:hypothetical protein